MYILKDIAKLTSGNILGNPYAIVKNLVSIDNPQNKACSIAYTTKSTLVNTDTVITTKELQDCFSNLNVIVVKNPAVAFALLSQNFAKKSNIIHKLAIVEESAHIGKNTQISAHCYIGERVNIGDNCYLYPGVKIMDNVQIGNNCIISSGVVIGSQGFGNALDEHKHWHRIHHFGGVQIGNNVTIGANTCIDCGTFEDTIIENGVRIDNLVHIAHNVKIGEHTAIAAKTGVAGSTSIGKRCQVGGKVGIVGHLTITDDVVIYATSTVNRSIKKSGFYTGFFPIIPHNRWKKIAMLLTKFDKIIKYLGIKIRNL